MRMWSGRALNMRKLIITFARLLQSEIFSIRMRWGTNVIKKSVASSKFKISTSEHSTVCARFL